MRRPRQGATPPGSSPPVGFTEHGSDADNAMPEAGGRLRPVVAGGRAGTAADRVRRAAHAAGDVEREGEQYTVSPVAGPRATALQECPAAGRRASS
eukprot:354185-Chlamydomonas_euryale.AAC.6